MATLLSHTKYFIVVLCLIQLSFFPSPSQAGSLKSDVTKLKNQAEQNNEVKETPEKTSSGKKGGFSLFKDKEMDFFPIPIFETRPDEGESYGAMPVFLFSEKDSKAISIILAAMGQYNSVVKASGTLLAHFFPRPVKNPDEVFEFFFEFGQKYARELTLHYANPKFFDKFFLDSRFMWLKTPFPRFYGYGAKTGETGESNFVSREFLFDTTFGYYLHKNLRVNFSEKFTTTDLLNRAFNNTGDTLTVYGAQEGVYDSTHLVHKLSVTFDNRPSSSISKKGTFAEASYFFSHKNLGSDSTFNGFSLEAVQLVSFFKERTTSAIRFFMQDIYGSEVPFYLQSRLGGPDELRAFIPNRFTDKGKMIFTLEQRIKVFGKTVFGVPVEVYADPFFEVGRVFNHLSNFSFNDLQPVGGLGLRGVVPPNVVARVDFAVGSEDYGVYTMLGYAF